MASLLTRKPVSLSNLFPSSLYHNLSILTPLFHFSTQIKQKEDVPFMAQYLISSFGFSGDRAIKVGSATNLVSIKTADRPESVVRFLKDNGLTDTQIKRAVSLVPNLLAISVSKTLEPRAREVIAAGFTRETLLQLIRHNPWALTHKNLVSRLQFWRNFVGSEEAFLKVTRKWGVLNLNIDKRVIPRINLLREYGLSDKDIAILFIKPDNFLLQSEDAVKSSIEQIEKIGFRRGSKMVLEGLVVFSAMKKDTLDKKVAFLKTTYGWSQEDISLAIKKFPRILVLSCKNINTTMDFLVKKVGFDPRSIALWPILLGFSLEKRLIPRHYVLDVLKSKGLKHKLSFCTMANLPEKQFFAKVILPHKEELPNLEEAYNAVCDGKMPLL